MAIARRSSSDRKGSGEAPRGNSPSWRPQAKTDLEATCADRLRRGHLDTVGLRPLARVDLELLEHPEHAGGVRRLAAQHRAQLAERLLRGAQRARLVQLRSAQHAGAALVRRGEQPRQPLLELGHERPRVARPREPIELLELPALVALPERPRLLGPVGALLANVGLEPVRQARHPQQPGSPEVGEQVVGRAVRRRAADQCQQAAAEAGVPEGQLAVDRVRDPVGAEDLLEQRRVARRAP